MILSFSSSANVVGVDTQNFNPTTNGLDFVTVQSSETLKPGIMNLGLFLNYAVNTLPNYIFVTEGERTSKEDALLSSDLNVGVGINRFWDVGLSIPSVLSQENNSDQLKGGFVSNGVVDLRLNTKLRTSGDDKAGTAVVISLNAPQIKNNPFEGDKSANIYNLEFVADKTFGKFATAVNVGYRFRDPGNQLSGVPVVPVDDQYLLSVAGNYRMESIDTKLIGEIYTSFPATSQQSVTDRELSTAELLFGAKHDLNNHTALHSGLATELSHGTSSPDWRIYFGVNWNVGPLWKKKIKKRKRRKQVQPAPPIVDIPQEPIYSDEPDPSVFPDTPIATRETYVLQLNYRTDSDKIPIVYKEYLYELVHYLSLDPPVSRLVIHGHTDSIGTENYNYDLSRRRAERVRNVLVQMGAGDVDIVVEPHGELDPIGDNGNYQGRKSNRRVEFEIFRENVSY